MSDMLTFIIAVLATYRIAYLVAFEEGPFALAERLRSWVVQRWGNRSWQGRGISCPLCLSFWIGLPAATIISSGSMVALYWLGIAGGVLFAHRVYEKLGR